jgi:hypothetical protein
VAIVLFCHSEESDDEESGWVGGSALPRTAS